MRFWRRKKQRDSWYHGQPLLMCSEVGNVDKFTDQMAEGESIAYDCRSCGVALVVHRVSMKMVNAGVIPICQPCGIRLHPEEHDNEWTKRGFIPPGTRLPASWIPLIREYLSDDGARGRFDALVASGYFNVVDDDEEIERIKRGE